MTVVGALFAGGLLIALSNSNHRPTPLPIAQALPLTQSSENDLPTDLPSPAYDCTEGDVTRNGLFYDICFCDEDSGCYRVPHGCHYAKEDKFVAIGATVDSYFDNAKNGFRLICEQSENRIRLAVKGCIAQDIFLKPNYFRDTGNTQIECAIENGQALLKYLTRDSKANDRHIEREAVKGWEDWGTWISSSKTHMDIEKMETMPEREERDVSSATPSPLPTEETSSETGMDLAVLSKLYDCGSLHPGQMFTEGSFYGACICKKRKCSRRIFGCYSEILPDEERQVAVGMSVDYAFQNGDDGFGIRKTCSRNTTKHFHFESTECYFDGVKIDVGDAVSKNDFRVSCLSPLHALSIRFDHHVPLSQGKHYRFNKCSRNEDEEYIVKKSGQSFYQKCSCCFSGCKEEPTACHVDFFPDSPRVAIGETVTRTIAVLNGEPRVPISYRYKCSLDCRGKIQLIATGCVHGDSFFSRGETLRVGDYEFYCQDRDPELGMRWKALNQTAPPLSFL